MATLTYNIPTDNVAGNATWAAVASADSAYPASNISLLTDLDRGNPAKLTIKTAGGWYADFGAAQRVDFVVLWHNGDVNQTVKIESHTATLSNPVTTPTMTTTLTLPAVREDGYFIKVYKDLTGVSGYNASGHRYWRVYFPVSGANNTQNWGLKVWMGSTIRTLDRAIVVPQLNAEQHIGVKMATDTGYEWLYDLQSAPRGLSGKIVLKYATSWANLVSLYRAAAGPIKIIPIVKDTSENDCWLVRLNARGISEGVFKDNLEVSQITSLVNPVNITFEEVTAGAPEWT